MNLSSDKQWNMQTAFELLMQLKLMILQADLIQFVRSFYEKDLIIQC